MRVERRARQVKEEHEHMWIGLQASIGTSQGRVGASRPASDKPLAGSIALADRLLLTIPCVAKQKKERANNRVDQNQELCQRLSGRWEALVAFYSSTFFPN
jgi:hypothetical protein